MNIPLLLIALLFILTSVPPTDPLLDGSMVGKAVLQQFLHIGLGLLLGRYWRRFYFKKGYQRASGLITFTFLIVFWSIPISVDLSEVHEWMDQLYHVSMLLGGFLLHRSFKGLPDVFRGAYGLLFSSMLISTGYVYKTKSVLLCSTYSLEDQHTYGRVVLFFGGILYVATVLWIIFKLGRRGEGRDGRPLSP